MDHPDKALAYAQGVLDGARPAGLYERQSCQRFIDDLEKQNNVAWPYYFDNDAAIRVCKFIELMPHIKGKWAKARKTIDLEPWQCFIVCNIFGWLQKQTGLRRFRYVYEELGRKNAKSTLLSAIGLYMLSADGEEGAEVYCAASDQSQARLVWNDAKRMAERCKGLQTNLGVETSAHSIHVFSTASQMKALSREQGGNHDGLNTHCALVDELHTHKTRQLYEVLESSVGARENFLIFCITTAGFNLSGICYEKRDYAIKVLGGVLEDDTLFAAIYTVDDEDVKNIEKLLSDPLIWQKANPNWGVSVNPEFIEEQAAKARASTKTRNNFLTKYLCVWTNTEAAWLDMAAVKRCADSTLSREEFIGDVAYKGTDLATRDDIASDVIIFPRIKDGVTHIYAFARHYLPEDTVYESPNASYKGWAEEGLIKATDGNTTDYDVIFDDFIDDRDNYRLRECGFDPYNSNQFVSGLISNGVNMVEVPQNVRHLSEPMKELESLIRNGRFHYDGDPVLTWMLSNVTCEEDKNENIFPRKARGQKQNKIDGAVALIIALNRYMASGVPPDAAIDRIIENGFVSIDL